MAEQELKIKISVDPDTGGLKTVKSEFDQLSKSADKAIKCAGDFKGAIDTLAHAT
jgi:hypothetical protein